MAYLLVYVDDIILTASTTSLLRHVVQQLCREFAIKDLGDLHFFLGVQVRCDASGFSLSQAQYTEDILERAGMSNCKPTTTPVDVKQKLSTTDVNQACLYMHSPRAAHWNFVKRILRYLRGSISDGLFISASPSTELKAYSDADWGGCPDTRRSTSGYYVFLGDSLVSWSSKRQPTVSRSSAEAEYRTVANATAECCWLRNLLQELHVPIRKATVIYCDNVSALKKHIPPSQVLESIDTVAADQSVALLPAQVLDVAMVRHGGTLKDRALVRCDKLPVSMSTWEDHQDMHRRYPTAWGQAAS
ncbi:uncharacterized mitochondrial protein AtMg00810-like [Miscanthus floridulus]|uniref:uncharacterized mitochondrial protein AtMg00810-like n=1 Tax=Miscanthus floridulus TaxID=154761 RepID=UPI00345A72B1